MTTKAKFTMKDDNKFRTPEFRVSFPYLFEPNKHGKKGVAMVFDKEGTDMKLLEAAIETLIKEKYPKGQPKGMLLPILDGDETDRDEYQGKWYINAKCGQYFRPSDAIIGPDREPIDDPNDLYAGCYGRAIISLYAWDNREVGKRGISVNLLAFQKTRDGESLISRVQAADEFDAVETTDDATADL